MKKQIFQIAGIDGREEPKSVWHRLDRQQDPLTRKDVPSGTQETQNAK